MWQVISKLNRQSSGEARHSSLITRRSQRGVALIITLIMLAVITFLATTFLVLSRHERGSVTTNTDQTTARFAADTGLERAKAQLLAAMLTTTNDQNFDLTGPTNFYNPAGFIPSLPAGSNPYTNVNYWYLNGNPLTPSDFLVNLTNLLYDPRPPVFITNRITGRMDFRYYLDLNRNGMFDPSGVVPNLVVDSSGIVITNGFISAVGDPQWVGVLHFPDRPHSADNQFVARWTYLVVPADKTLDVNYLHNQAVNRVVNPSSTATVPDTYLRNQGVGPWEINMAAFLADLNTNFWYTNNPLENYLASAPSPAPYEYRQATTGFPNLGSAFDDARAFVSYRYNYAYATLRPASVLFTNFAAALAADNIDEYSHGPLMVGNTWAETVATADPVGASWLGADNTNHYFTTQEFFDPNKTGNTPANFSSRLIRAGQQTNSYDRYTFYRMLAQLGTDSSPEYKMNINYKNVVNGVIYPGMETNLIAWTPLDFFTNAAAQMFQRLNLRDNYGNLITVTNIPLYPNNYYTPAVHRILQLAANMYDASTNGMYPSIFRPMFSVNNITNYVISGYELVNSPGDLHTPDLDTMDPGTCLNLPLDLNDSTTRAKIGTSPTSLNLYGVPWVIGAKKGVPNFNQLEMQTASQITRKLKMWRPDENSSLSTYKLAQLYLVGISNVIGVSVWNSYQTNYPSRGGVYVQADGNLTMSLTNDVGLVPPGAPSAVVAVGGFASSVTIAQGQWRGCGWIPGSTVRPSELSFKVPLFTNYIFLPDMAYQQSPPAFIVPPANTSLVWPNPVSRSSADFPQPQWMLNVTNHIRCFISDGGAPPNGRIVDYVQLNGPILSTNLTAEIRTPDNATGFNGLWSVGTNNTFAQMNLPLGLINQLNISAANYPSSDVDWQNNMLNTPTGNARLAAIDYFRVFMHLSPLYFPNTLNNTNVMQVPFTPTSKTYQNVVWSANDPLVHYMAGDLNDPATAGTIYTVRPPNSAQGLPGVFTNLVALTTRYSPWGGPPLKTGGSSTESDTNAFNIALKDPGLVTSDGWDFPTNKFPNIGWIGRIHRGTPWQTVYLKSSDVDPGAWGNWSGDTVNWFLGGTNAADLMFHRPINDRMLLDVFTASLNPSASRAHLSINQTNLAAWSAILSEVVALTNNLTTNNWMLIPPAGVFDPTAAYTNLPPLAKIWEGINATRSSYYVFNGKTNYNFANQTFHSLGDILAVPQLTEYSPFLNTNGLANITAGGITDEMMERIPQQTLGLLTLSHSPRFVIYSFGQTLRPANNSIVTAGGNFFGLCTNYQITAETATRAVVHVEGTPDPRYARTPDPNGNKYPPHIVVEQYNVLPPD
jgi:hypothetical protein